MPSIVKPCFTDFFFVKTNFNFNRLIDKEGTFIFSAFRLNKINYRSQTKIIYNSCYLENITDIYFSCILSKKAAI